MKKLLIKFRDWSRNNVILSGIVSVLVIGTPSIISIILSGFLITNHVTHAILSLAIFAVYFGCYILFTKLINKL